MNFLAGNIVWFIILLFFLGFFGVLLIQGRDRFWMAPFGIWILLIIFLCIGNSLSSQPESLFGLQDSTLVKNKTMDENPVHLEEVHRIKHDFDHNAIMLVEFQSFFCLFWFLCGYKKTNLRFYKTGAISYFIISVLCLIITTLSFV